MKIFMMMSNFPLSKNYFRQLILYLTCVRFRVITAMVSFTYLTITFFYSIDNYHRNPTFKETFIILATRCIDENQVIIPVELIILTMGKARLFPDILPYFKYMVILKARLVSFIYPLH